MERLTNLCEVNNATRHTNILKGGVRNGRSLIYSF